MLVWSSPWRRNPSIRPKGVTLRRVLSVVGVLIASAAVPAAVHGHAGEHGPPTPPAGERAPEAAQVKLLKAPAAGTSSKPGGAPPIGKAKAAETEFSYNGGTIAPNEAARRGLACSTPAEGMTRCYDDYSEMAGAEKFAPLSEIKAMQAGKSRKTKRRKGARASTHYGGSAYPYVLYQHAGYAGWLVATNSHCQWFDLPGFYGGNASSLTAGQHTAIGATAYGGNGLIPSWGAWANESNLGTWNDKLYSRARVCL